MQIWVDADACPRAIKEILFRAAERTEVLLFLVANQPLRTPPSEYIRSIIVPGGFDVADEHISGSVQSGDLVITADIPLAAAVIAKGAYALNPRGTFYNKDNIGEALSVRNWMSDLRSSGVETGGPASFSPRDRENFANQLDRFLSKHGRQAE